MKWTEDEKLILQFNYQRGIEYLSTILPKKSPEDIRTAISRNIKGCKWHDEPKAYIQKRFEVDDVRVTEKEKIENENVLNYLINNEDAHIRNRLFYDADDRLVTKSKCRNEIYRK
jgi:hypothetical protein